MAWDEGDGDWYSKTPPHPTSTIFKGRQQGGEKNTETQIKLKLIQIKFIYFLCMRYFHIPVTEEGSSLPPGLI